MGEFGTSLGITQPIVARWNSTLGHVRSVLKLDGAKLASVLRDAEKSHLILSPRDYSCLEELEYLLAPFLEATDAT